MLGALGRRGDHEGITSAIYGGDLDFSDSFREGGEEETRQILLNASKVTQHTGWTAIAHATWTLVGCRASLSWCHVGFMLHLMQGLILGLKSGLMFSLLRHVDFGMTSGLFSLSSWLSVSLPFPATGDSGLSEP